MFCNVFALKVTLGQRRGLSPSDVRQMNLMYNCGQGRMVATEPCYSEMLFIETTKCMR